MPDLNHVIDAHTSQMQEWWWDPEYIRERKAFVKRRPVCDRCGRPATTPGHSHEDYRDFETYLNAVKTDKCDALCSACNKAERAQRRPCPSCCEKYKRDPTTKIHYITPDQEMCRYCEPSYNPEVAKVRRERGNKIKRELNQGGYIKAHPFKKAIVNGRCVSIRR